MPAWLLLAAAFLAQAAPDQRYGEGAATDPAAAAEAEAEAARAFADDPTTEQPAAGEGADAAAETPASDAPASEASSQITISPASATPALAEDTPTTAPAAGGASTPPAETAGADVGTPPAESTTAAAAAAEPPAAPKPADLMRALLVTPVTDQLAGVPITLGTAVRDATTRPAQTVRAQAYWDLSAAVAQYYLALQERYELGQLKGQITAPAVPAAAWDAAEADAITRVEFTRQAAIAAQIRMHALLGANAGPSLPLPADSPHCGRYNTRYDELFAARPHPIAQHYDTLIPLVHRELTALTRQVAAAHDFLNFIIETRDIKNDGAGVLVSYQLMTERRRAFLEAARQYNRTIAAYAELATPEGVEPDRLVAMLIRSSSDATGDANVQPASATEDVNSDPSAASDNNATLPPTIRETSERTTWRPLDRLRGRERSIITARRKAFRR
jgi:hypothetical protein